MGKALVVDDSFIARKIISDMLITLEHEVAAELSNGEKIIESYENNDVDFCLVVTQLRLVFLSCFVFVQLTCRVNLICERVLFLSKIFIIYLIYNIFLKPF